ncbi:MAG: 2'-5' RNA ligase family protein [Steroidobacteraceae bacterium]
MKRAPQLVLRVLTMPCMAAADRDVIAIDVLIEPGGALADQARALNARLRRDTPEGFALDATHIPHLSILHRFVRSADLERLSQAVAAIVAHPEFPHWRLMATGLQASNDGAHRSIVIDVQRTPALQQLQAGVEAAVAPFVASGGGADAFVRTPGPPEIEQGTIDYVATFVPLRVGAGFSPHLTVGKCSPRLAEQLLAERFTPVEFTIQRIAIYQLGNHGTARVRLWPR